MSDPARTRWLAMIGVRLGGMVGALFGLMLIARATTTGQKVLGTAIILSALVVMAVVPAALARRWRSRG